MRFKQIIPWTLTLLTLASGVVLTLWTISTVMGNTTPPEPTSRVVQVPTFTPTATLTLLPTLLLPSPAATLNSDPNAAPTLTPTMTITATPAPTLFASVEQVAGGQELFNLYCIGCHGLGGVGSNVAPAFNNRPPLDADVIRRQVRSGRYAMTPFDPTHVSDDQLELLVRYIQSLGVIEQ